MSFLLRVIINAVAIWLATRVLAGLDVVGGDDTTTTVLVFLRRRPRVRPRERRRQAGRQAILSFPLYILTLGLFTLVVNALMLLLTGWLSERTKYGLRIDNFGTAVLGALIISVVSFVLNVALRAKK